MELALKEASEAASFGEVPVGALLLNYAGKLLACANNRMERDRNPLAHAELICLMKAIDNVGKDGVRDSILIVTLEPCLMCSAALIHARIGGVVFGALDNNAGALVSCYDYINLPGARKEFWHMGGVLSKKCSDLLRRFFGDRRR